MVVENGVFIFSFTYHFEKNETVKVMEKLKDKFICQLKSLAGSTIDKFIFQGERGDVKGLLHYQGYFHVNKKNRPTTLMKEFRFNDKGMNIKRCSTAGINALKTYCMKAETRVCGPWADKIIYMGEDLPIKLLGWQKHLEKYILGPIDDREILWIYDKNGGSGKSIFAKYMCFKHGVMKLTYGKSGDLLNLVSKRQNRKCYIFDLSRTKPSTFSNEDLYSAIEDIKCGHFINTKYETDDILMRKPHVIVFANHLPKQESLSADMWNIMALPENCNPYKKKKRNFFKSKLFSKVDFTLELDQT